MKCVTSGLTVRMLPLVSLAACLTLGIAGVASATTITVVNGTTSTILNPTQQSSQAGALATQTVFTAPYVTTGAQDSSFGQDGYVMMATSPTGITSGVYVGVDPMTNPSIPAGTSGNTGTFAINTLIKQPSYLTVSDSGYVTGLTAGYGYPTVYARDGSAANTVQAGVAIGANESYGTPATLAKMSIGSNVPSNIYVGVLAGQYFDSPSAITLTDTTSGASATATPQIYYTNITAGANWFFFDISGAQTGDVLQLSEAQYNTGASYDQHPSLYGLTFDSTNPLSSVPEPTTAAITLAGIGGAFLMARRKRRIG